MQNVKIYFTLKEHHLLWKYWFLEEYAIHSHFNNNFEKLIKTKT